MLKAVLLLYFVTLLMAKTNAGPIKVKRSDHGPIASIRSQKLPMHKASGLNSMDNGSIQALSLVPLRDNADTTRQVDRESTLLRSFYPVDEEEAKSKSNLKYGVTNIGSRQHRYGEGTWRPNPDQNNQEKARNLDNNNSSSSSSDNIDSNISNYKSVPRRKEKSVNDADNQGHVHDPASATSAIQENDVRKIVALDNHGQLHTLALPMTILPGL